MKASDFLDAQLGTAEPAAPTSKARSAKDFLDEQLGKTEAPAQTTGTAEAPSAAPDEGFLAGLGRHALGSLAAVARGAAGTVGSSYGLNGLALRALGVNTDPAALAVARKDLIPGGGLLAAPLAANLAVQAGSQVPDPRRVELGAEQGALSAAGAPGNYLEPKNALDKYSYAAARGLGGALPVLPLAPAAMAMGGTTGGVGTEVGQDLTPGSAVGPIVGGLVGGGFGQGALGVAQHLMTPSLGTLARTVGSAESMEEAGTHLQTAGTKFLTEDHKALQNAAWEPVDSVIDPNTPVDLGAYKAALGSVNKDFGPMTQAAKLIGGGALKAKELLEHANALSDPDVGVGPTWAQMANFRTYLGDNLSNARVNVDIPQKQMKQLYAGLTSDMRTAAHAQGAGDAFDAANAQSRALFDTADKVAALTKTGTDKPAVGASAPAKVAESLIRNARSGGADLEALRAAHPDLDAAVNELAAAHLTPSDTGSKLPMFHTLSEEGQSALLPYGKLRAQAVAASKAADLPSKADLTNTAVGGLLGGEMGRYAAEFAGLPPSVMGGLALGGAVAPFAIRNARALTARPLSLAGPALGADEGYAQSELPDLVVRPRAGR